MMAFEKEGDIVIVNGEEKSQTGSNERIIAAAVLL
jgi:hypothetical protein